MALFSASSRNSWTKNQPEGDDIGLDPNKLPDRLINRIANKLDRPKGRLTAEEAAKAEELRTERQHQKVFKDWLNLCLSRNELIFEHDFTHRETTNVPGFPDFRIYMFGPTVLFVEFKMKAGRMSYEQEAVKGVLESFRFRYLIVRSDKEAIEKTQKILTPTLELRKFAIAEFRRQKAEKEAAERQRRTQRTLGQNNPAEPMTSLPG